MKIRNVRFIIAALATFGAYAVYVSRINLSIAIIAMVDQNPPNHQQSSHQEHSSSSSSFPSLSSGDQAHHNHKLDYGINNATSYRYQDDDLEHSKSQLANNNESFVVDLASAPNLGANSRIFPAPKKSFESPLISQVKFHWDQTEQGHILGAFFYGYIIFQIPGARIAESVGAKWILFTGIFSSAVISLVFPLSAQLNSLHLLMLLRFIMGLSQSAFFPAAYVLFCRWLPERERSILLPMMFIGSNVGSISTYIMSSYLITSNYGWPSVFYLSGLVCLLVSLLWCIFVSSVPDDNWLITDDECQFINKNVCNQSSELNSLNEQPVDDDDDHHEEKSLSRSRRSPSSDSIGLEKKFAHYVDFTIYQQQLNHHHQLNLMSSSLPHSDHLPVPVLRHNSISAATKLAATARLKAQEAKRSSTLTNANYSNKKSSSSQQHINLGATMTSTATRHYVSIAPEPSWNKLLTSVPIWTLVFSMYGNEWSNVVICFLLPTYLNTALNFPMKQNGAINSFFQLCFAVSSPIMSSLGAYILDNHLLGMRKIHVRKLFQSIATFGQCICYLMVPICGSNRDLIITFMFFLIIFKSCANAGDIMVSGDLSPEYAGTLFAFANSVGNTAGFFVPELAGFFVQDARIRDEWTPFWLTTAGIMCISGLIFLIFGVTRRQEFGPDTVELCE